MPRDCVLKNMREGCVKKGHGIVCDKPSDFECDEKRFLSQNAADELIARLKTASLLDNNRFKERLRAIIGSPPERKSSWTAVDAKRDEYLKAIDKIAGGKYKTKRRKTKRRKTRRVVR